MCHNSLKGDHVHITSRYFRSFANFFLNNCGFSCCIKMQYIQLMREHETMKYSTETFSELKSRITLYLWISTATDTFAIGLLILSWPCHFNDVFFHPSLKMLFVNRHSCSWFVRLVEQVVEPIFRIEPANQPNPSSHYPNPEKRFSEKQGSVLQKKCTSKKGSVLHSK